MRKISYFLITGLIAVSFAMACKVVTDDEGSDKGVRSFKLTEGEVSGWTVMSCFDFNVSNCTNNAGLNGGASEYLNKGMVEGFRQQMTNSDNSSDIFIMDFGNNNNAALMFNAKSSAIDNQLSVTGYELTVAVMKEFPDGVNVYAHFGKYYFEVHFTGYLDVADAKNAAASFIEMYEDKL